MEVSTFSWPMENMFMQKYSSASLFSFTQCGSRQMKFLAVAPIMKCAFPGRPPKIPAKALIFMMVRMDYSISTWGLLQPIRTKIMMRPGWMVMSQLQTIDPLFFLMKLGVIDFVLSLLATLRYSKAEVDQNSLWKMMHLSLDCSLLFCSYFRMNAVQDGVNHSPAPFLYNLMPALTSFWMLQCPSSPIKLSMIPKRDVQLLYFSMPSALLSDSASIICPTLSMHPHPTSEVSAESLNRMAYLQVNQRVEQQMSLAISLSGQKWPSIHTSLLLSSLRPRSMVWATLKYCFWLGLDMLTPIAWPNTTTILSSRRPACKQPSSQEIQFLLVNFKTRFYGLNLIQSLI